METTLSPLGRFRTRAPESVKLVKDVEAGLKQYKGYLRTQDSQHNKAAYQFVVRYTKLRNLVKVAGFEMEQVFPGLAKAHSTATNDSLTALERLKAIETQFNQDLYAELTIGTSPVVMPKTESIWHQSAPKNIGEDFRTLAGLDHTIPRLSEKTEKTPAGYYDYKNLSDSDINTAASKAVGEYRKSREAGQQVHGRDSAHSFDYVIGAIEQLAPKLSKANQDKLASDAYRQNFRHTGFSMPKLPKAIRTALYWAGLHVRPKNIVDDAPWVRSQMESKARGPLKEVAGSDVGKTILAQMGGAGRIKAMTGANFSFTPDGVIIQWPSRQRSRGNVVEIELKPDDTYELRFLNVSTMGRKPVKTYDGVYFDQLVSIFEKQTGLYLKL